MDNCVRNINKHLKNFDQVAGQLTKVVIPIVDKAVKMSSEEPISAYSVFKQAKEFVEKKKKKNSCDFANTENMKRQVKKHSCARIGVGTKPAIKSKSTTAQRRVSANKNKANTCIKDKSRKTKQLTENKNVREKNFNGAEVLNLVDQLYSGNSKLTKSENGKKKELEDYLTKQLEMDDLEAEDDDSFDSNCTSCSDSYSDETTVDESGRFSNDENLEEETSTYDGNNPAAEALALTLVSKKRKSPSTLNATKTNSKAKKTKSSDTKSTARKSFPIVKADNVSDNKTSYKQHSLTSNIGSLKKSTPKATDLKESTVSNIKLEPLSPPPNIIKLNSIEEGKRAFAWLLNPLTVDDFFAKYWEQKACLIKRQQSNYFNHLISFEAIDQMLLKNHVEFTKNIDVTSYKNGVRETLNPEGRALPPVVWHHYGNDCSIRLLNPQTFLSKLYTLCTTMQEYFHCLVGANAYLTPPNSQGFAPHYDDIEAFVLQIEGRKLWKLYKPRSTSDTLPRYSSKNFTEQEIGEPVLEEILEPGDVLYFPRGTVHQACTESGHHSLHITLSVYQKQSFADLFEKILPIMLQKAITSNVDLRKGLPLNVWQHAGVVYSDNFTKARADLKKKVTQLMHKCIRDMPLQDIIDAGIDQLAKRFQHEALPPEILPCEKLRTVFGSRSRASENGECLCDYDINERTNVRLLRANILRLVKEEEKIRIYYYLDNSMEYCEYGPNFIEIEPMEAASVEVLIKSYPQYVGISELPLKSIEQRIDFATALWERGLLMMEKPFR